MKVIATLSIVLCLVVSALAARQQQLRFGEVHMLPFSNNVNTNVTDINTFADVVNLVRDDDRLYIAYFYDSLDINSIRLGSSIEEAAGMLKGFADVVALDIREPQLQWIHNAWGIQVVPSIKAVLPRKHARSKLGENHPINSVGGIKSPVDYSGKDFNAETIKKWALNQLTTQPFIEKLNDQSFEGLTQALARPHNTIVALFTDKDATSQLYKALATKFFGRAAFIECFKGKSKKIVSHFKVKKFPTLAIFPQSDGKQHKVHIYSGKLNIQDLSEFVSQYVISREEKQSTDRQNEVKQINLDKQRSADPVMQIRSIEHWNQLVLSSKSTVGILFGNPKFGDTKEHLASLAKAKRVLLSKKKSPVSDFFWIDGTTQTEVSSFFSKGSFSDTANALSFISPAKGAFNTFVGALSADGVTKFVNGGGLNKGGSQFTGNDLPNFHDETLQ